MISEVRIFSGRAGGLEMPIEAREALHLRDGDQVEVVIRKKKPKSKMTPEAFDRMISAMAREKLFIRSNMIF